MLEDSSDDDTDNTVDPPQDTNADNSTGDKETTVTQPTTGNAGSLLQADQEQKHMYGCVGEVYTKVWGPQDVDEVCDLCGTARYDDSNQPIESVVNFPLRKR